MSTILGRIKQCMEQAYTGAEQHAWATLLVINHRAEAIREGQGL